MSSFVSIIEEGELVFRQISFGAVLVGVFVACTVRSPHASPPSSSEWQDSVAAGAQLTAIRERFTRDPLAIGKGVAIGFEETPFGVRPIMVAIEPRATSKIARTYLPKTAKSAAHVSDDTTRVGLSFTLRGATDVPVATADGLALYAHGGPQGADIVYRAHAEGVEDFLVFETKPEREELVYDVRLEEVAGLRLVSNVLELLDSSGTPRVRVASPYATDAAGKRYEAKLAVEGCAVDTDPRAPFGRGVTPPNSSSCRVHVSWSGTDYPLLVDPSWTTTGAMTAKRGNHQASLLGNGRVLVTGGMATGQEPTAIALNSAELYDPSSRTWTATGGMLQGRQKHQQATLSNGKVLVIGGKSSPPPTGGPGGGSALNNAEIYDPSNGAWVATGSLATPRFGSTSVVLASGKVLIAGGLAASQSPYSAMSSAELYDPGIGVWSATGAMNGGRAFHRAALLGSGKVLVMAGVVSSDAGGNITLTNSAEAYDPATGLWTPTGAMTMARNSFASVVLPSGKVLVAGGYGVSTLSSSAETFDPLTGSWTQINPMLNARRGHDAVLIDGKALFLGGAPAAPAELFDPSSGVWSVSDSLNVVRDYHTTSVLSDGKVLAAGGIPAFETTSSAELYLLRDGAMCATGSDCVSGFCVDKVCCNVGCAGQCQSCNEATAKGTCTTVTGKPRGLRPLCAGDGTACAGQCDGVSPSVCASFPPATTACGCTGSSIATCNGAGTCLAPVACQGNLVCDGQTACKTKCTANADCVTGFACQTDGTCQPQQAASCVDDHTSKSVAGVSKDCAPYKCSTAGTCLNQCASVSDCIAPTVCNETGQCVPAEGSTDDGGGCALSPIAPRSERGVVAFLASSLALTVIRRRRGSKRRAS